MAKSSDCTEAKEALRRRLEQLWRRICAGECLGETTTSTKWSHDFAKFEAACAAAGIEKLRARHIGWHAEPLRQSARRAA